MTDKLQVRPAIEEAMSYNGPAVVDFVVEQEDNVYPMIPAGTTIEQLMEEPTLQRVNR